MRIFTSGVLMLALAGGAMAHPPKWGRQDSHRKPIEQPVLWAKKEVAKDALFDCMMLTDDLCEYERRAFLKALTKLDCKFEKSRDKKYNCRMSREFSTRKANSWWRALNKVRGME